MFELIDPISATLKSLTPRTERHGEDDVFAISLGLSITAPNTLLDRLSSTLRKTLYMPVEGQSQLPGVEESTPLLRSKDIEELKVKGRFEGWTLNVDHGIDASEPITIGDGKCDAFKVLAMEGGTIELSFRFGSNDVDAMEAGLLCSKLHQEVSITLKAPEKQPEPIDGSQAAFDTDHPDAGQLFADAHRDPDDAESEGGETDAEQPADVQRSDWPDGPAPKRTARGKAKTAAALEQGVNS